MEVTLSECRKALDALQSQEALMEGQPAATINNFLLAVKRELEKSKKVVLVTNDERGEVRPIRHHLKDN